MALLLLIVGVCYIMMKGNIVVRTICKVFSVLIILYWVLIPNEISSSRALVTGIRIMYHSGIQKVYHPEVV